MSKKKIPFEGARWEQENWQPEDSDHQGQLNSYIERLKQAEATIETQNKRLSDLSRQLENYRSRDSDYNKVLSGRDETVKRLTAERDQARRNLSDAEKAHQNLVEEKEAAAEEWRKELESAQSLTGKTERSLQAKSLELEKQTKKAETAAQFAKEREDRLRQNLQERSRHLNRAIISTFAVGALGFFAFFWALAGTPVPWGEENLSGLDVEQVLANCVYDLQNANEGREIGQPISELAGVLGKPDSLLLGENDRARFPEGVMLADIDQRTQNYSPRRIEWSANITLPQTSALQGMTIEAYRIAPIENSEECRLIWQGRLTPEDGNIYLLGATTRRLTLSAPIPNDLAEIEGARWFFTNPQFDLLR